MTLNVGFLGYGFMGDAHANALARLPMFFPDGPEITNHVLIGRNESTMVKTANRLGFSTTTTDWHTTLNEIDVLYNLGPNHLHPEPSIEALRHGVHVLCEKPLAHTLDAASRMAEAAQTSDATTGVAFNYRFVPAIAYAKALIDDGELGDIRAFRGRYLQDWLVDPEEPWSWRNDSELAGSGALGDLGAHTIDLARFLIGDAAGGGEIERVSGQLRTFVDERPLEGEDGMRPVTVDDAYTAQLAFADGATGVLEASRVACGHKNDHTVAIHGTKGGLRFSLERLNELQLLRERNRGYETVLVTDESDPYVEAWWPPGHILGWEHTIVHENYEFLTAAANNEPFDPDFEEGLATQQILSAIECAARNDEWVDV